MSLINLVIKIYLSKKNYILSIFFLIMSILVSFVILYLERKFLNISSTFHPDTSHYLKYYKLYKTLSFDYSFILNIKNYFIHFFSNSLFYSIVNLFHELEKINPFSSPYRNIVKFNMLIYAITNALILFFYLKENKEINYLKLFGILFFCFLPYKLHLSVSVLKETLLIFFLSIYVIFPGKLSLIISFFFGTPLRSSFGMYYLVLIDFNKNFFKKNYLIILLLVCACIIIFIKQVYLSNFEGIFEYIESRNLANMGGREFDRVPKFNEFGLIGSLFRMLIWPILFLTGGFIFFSDNIFMFIIGIEVITLQILMFAVKRKLLISFGILIFLILVALYVNTYSSFLRYSYLGLNVLFLKNFIK
tara:strand:+ start:1336 stop:2418 length:1083 start_codon:yes stop_codon:yes gene_type:complete